MAEHVKTTIQVANMKGKLTMLGEVVAWLAGMAALLVGNYVFAVWCYEQGGFWGLMAFLLLCLTPPALLISFGLGLYTLFNIFMLFVALP